MHLCEDAYVDDRIQLAMSVDEFDLLIGCAINAREALTPRQFSAEFGTYAETLEALLQSWRREVDKIQVPPRT